VKAPSANSQRISVMQLRDGNIFQISDFKLFMLPLQCIVRLPAALQTYTHHKNPMKELGKSKIYSATINFI
jgi:hypothetical protein